MARGSGGDGLCVQYKVFNTFKNSLQYCVNTFNVVLDI